MRRTEVCCNCRHWLGAGLKQRGPKGQCRRNPPTITERAPFGAFPVTDSGDWCGEWTRVPGLPPGAGLPGGGQESPGGPTTLYDEM
ncbi:MAG: hypothetical protein RLY86_3139 [Pseudomonadota bacterium]